MKKQKVRTKNETWNSWIFLTNEVYWDFIRSNHRMCWNRQATPIKLEVREVLTCTKTFITKWYRSSFHIFSQFQENEILVRDGYRLYRSVFVHIFFCFQFTGWWISENILYLGNNWKCFLHKTDDDGNGVIRLNIKPWICFSIYPSRLQLFDVNSSV